MSVNPLDDEEPPLDPVLARVQARLRRLMLIGGLTLVIGITAVLLAIVYRFFIADRNEEPAAANGAPFVIGEVTATEVGLPATAELISTTLDGDRMVLGFRDGADTVMVLVDTTTMAVTGQFRVAAE
ncbi:MAG: hypothetical protein AB7O56_09090 [Bauldia sp.]